jgi:hypothetical protein
MRVDQTGPPLQRMLAILKSQLPNPHSPSAIFAFSFSRTD